MKFPTFSPFWTLNLIGAGLYLGMRAFAPGQETKASRAPASGPFPSVPGGPPKAPTGYMWVRSTPEGQVQTPTNGQMVWSVLQDDSGKRWTILVEAYGIDEAGNFEGTVQNNGGYAPIVNGSNLTVPLGAILWNVPTT